MLRVIAACGNGMGSSQLIKMKIEKTLKKLNISAKVDHMSVGEAKSVGENYDVIFCPKHLMSNFSCIDNNRTKIIGLINLMSEKEIEEKIKEYLMRL
ncbi:phosphotransferase system lactose/cellobiose-specific IIB subunit [Thermoanaerobacter mathranii subsp. mathranii str. A3]|uniref:Phosphotransferase system lactose/cellobiose-specific IIB subunit n=1 Tax=Thermoanaerobacter mathranii subsp. mathranii (strain DSM 11426 / CCUG 53645 / CIP 108742 / A3) TaxID=583358 RepID=A0ABM5LN09_THEM3|nr:PTS sugar transporter subunit IIB [Thermoanaerobacter mathranii]ADH60121.1 phosphotransferase system lactose/cellobiose-specific IIB subunit [Thermoanaerobacter mathranii subsp. mathranii str. A3]